MQFVTVVFPILAGLVSALAYLQPTWFMPAKSLIVPLLVLIMFGMGMVLTGADFRRVLRRPRAVLLGVALQYLVMPLAAFLVAKALSLPPELLVGLVLVGACPGGTASNVICYLARGDVALSVTLTMSSTLLAVLATPALTWLYAGQSVPVPVAEMLFDVVKIVVVPVGLGVLINTLWAGRVRRIQPVFPAISVAGIVFIIGVIVALNQTRIAEMGMATLLAVVLHNGIGIVTGYVLARALGFELSVARTLAIEVGMQNSGLAVALAVKHFSALAALPGAVFSIWHNLSGSLLAATWARNSGRGQKAGTDDVRR
ncbi:MAG: bile acid:sodium symporter [Gammaproteobacteria bacterium SG8_47]|nr:MAG: bile acid:sodium symporter [Gammaproteobacteria bacterium SG8_47]